MNLGGNWALAGVLVAALAGVPAVVAAATTVAILARNRRRARRAVHGLGQAAADGVWQPGDPGYGDTLRSNTIYPEEWPEAWQDDRRAGEGNDGLGKRPGRPGRDGGQAHRAAGEAAGRPPRPAA